jgi:hemoglobin
MSTIYQQIGGAEALEDIVDDFYARVLADSEPTRFFAGANMSRLIGKQAEFFATALGGPGPYSGPSMRQVHQGRGITMRHFELVGAHLTESFYAAGASEEITEQIVSEIASMADEIVTRGASERAASPSDRPS